MTSAGEVGSANCMSSQSIVETGGSGKVGRARLARMAAAAAAEAAAAFEVVVPIETHEPVGGFKTVERLGDPVRWPQQVRHYHLPGPVPLPVPGPATTSTSTSTSTSASTRTVPGASLLTTALADTTRTRGLVDAATLASAKPGCVILNVARAELVDEAALHGALESAHLGGALLDFWWRYPTREEPSRRPSAFPFHQLPASTMLTPHASSPGPAKCSSGGGPWDGIAVS